MEAWSRDLDIGEKVSPPPGSSGCSRLRSMLASWILEHLSYADMHSSSAELPTISGSYGGLNGDTIGSLTGSKQGIQNLPSYS